MLLPLIQGKGNPVLREMSQPVTRFDKKLHKLIKDMQQTMMEEKGIGLAAIQIGSPVRLAMIRMNHDTDQEISVAIINPEIIEFSEETTVAEEGCLSLPKIFGRVARAKSITVKFFDKNGEKKVLKLEGLNARVVQHEIDHMDGILFIDKLIADSPEVM
jgi:peptide deformylase